MSDILAELGSYRALGNGPLTHPTTIVSFQARSAATHHPVDPRDFMDPFVPPSVTRSDMPVNFIQIVTNRNNWYLDADAIDLARRVRQAPCVRPRASGRRWPHRHLWQQHGGLCGGEPCRGA
jgi:hypothetical protein